MVASGHLDSKDEEEEGENEVANRREGRSCSPADEAANDGTD